MVFEKKEEEKPKEEPKVEEPVVKPEVIPPEKEEKKEEAKQEEVPPFDAKVAYEELAAKVASLMDAMDKIMALLEEEKQEVNEVPPVEPMVAEQGKHSKEFSDLTEKVANLEKKIAQFSVGIKKTIPSDAQVRVEVDEAYLDLKRKNLI